MNAATPYTTGDLAVIWWSTIPVLFLLALTGGSLYSRRQLARPALKSHLKCYCGRAKHQPCSGRGVATRSPYIQHVHQLYGAFTNAVSPETISRAYANLHLEAAGAVSRFGVLCSDKASEDEVSWLSRY